jgi:hypothetical protein
METVHRILPNNEILADAIKLVNEGQRVTLPVKGNSMLPFIIGGVESVELVKPETVKVGDVVLAWINGNRFVVHRVIRISGDRVQLMGDGNLGGDERCSIKEVSARADYVIGKDGQKRYLYTPWRIRGSRLWWKLRPVRRIILGVYKRTYLKLKI